MMIGPAGPLNVIWDVTYACPLRCMHCYSESGRRASRQLRHEDMLRAADAIIALRPQAVALAGGEPLVVKGILEIADRFTRAGIWVSLYTSAWTLGQQMIPDLEKVLSEITVSIDGATAETHDRVRGRVGSFERCMSALNLLDNSARNHREHGTKPLRFGVDFVAVKSNFHQIERFCTDVSRRFPEMSFVSFGAAVPSGLASREGFADRELLDDGSISRMRDAEWARSLQSLTPPGVKVNLSDNRILQYHPDWIAHGRVFPTMQIEPDGGVRAMAIYEGVVGNILTESATVLWDRCVERWDDPFVVETLRPAHTMMQWAEAARRIDYHFGSESVRARIDSRPAFPNPQVGDQVTPGLTRPESYNFGLIR